MGRPEPCVLFAQTILHSQLDEYVDEVQFSEPVVITACEILEQNASPSTPSVSLVGATSPPSFALEVFVHCEGESRFRRLCQPFLYSHLSSNVLEVEASVTSHLVLRGTYRSLTLVIYGNTAEDLGQFNIELDLDNSLANVVYSPSEGKLEDLPPALYVPNKFKFNFEESAMPYLKSLNFRAAELDISPKMKRLFMMVLKICRICGSENLDLTVLSSVLASVLPHESSSQDSEKFERVFGNAKSRLLEIGKNLELESELEMEWEMDLPTAENMVDLFDHCFPFFKSDLYPDLHLLQQNKSLILQLGLVLLLCQSREGCIHFVSSSGIDQIALLLSHQTQESTAISLLLVNIIERATRHGIGCESFLGWWPRTDDTVPARISTGFSSLLKLLLEKPRHDVASLSTCVLHRLRFYEELSRYESAVVSLFTNLSNDGPVGTEGAVSLVAANSHLIQISKLMSLCGPIEDPSPVAFAQEMLNLGNSDGLLSYKATVNSIAKSKYSFTHFDIDPHLLSLLKERGFFPLSAALLSSPVLRSASGTTADTFVEIATSIESIILSLLFCRTGLLFLLDQVDATGLVVLSLRESEEETSNSNSNRVECVTLRQASLLLSKGFFCHPHEIGLITQLHLKVGNAVDRLLLAPPNSDELLWVLWELCAISRSDSGRQALLALGFFPEAVSVLLESLRSYKDLDPTSITGGSGSPLGLAIFHSAAEIFEVLVADPTASSLSSWIGITVELHRALHSSSPGSNRKDAPTRLLEWIDASVVYHRNGAIGLLQFAAVLASGGDSIDAESMFADSAAASSDGHIIDGLLGKLVSDKYFDGFALRSTSIVQLTTAFRILAFVSEDLAVAAPLFEEGAITLVYVILVNCKSMLERLSNSYDYLVDEGAELSSTNDLLLDRRHEQELVDLMIPSLLLLLHVLKKLQETKEQYRNKKLLNALLRLHREISPKVGACAGDLSFLCPGSVLGFGAVCHLITSALAFWPVFGWAPHLFQCLVQNLDAKLPVGPKDACSLLCLLGDLFPDEGMWEWKSEIPPLSVVRNLSIGTVLGPLVEREVNWYFAPHHLSALLLPLTPQLDKISLVVLNFATSALMVVKDMLRVFVVRIACQKMECAVVLLRPIFAWLNDVSNETSLSDMDLFKVHKLLHFIASLLEHPKGKELLCKMGAVRVLRKLLEGSKSPWSLPLLKSLSLIFSSQLSIEQAQSDKCLIEDVSIEESSSIVLHLLKLFQVLPVGKELLACALTFKEVVSTNVGRNSLSSIVAKIQSKEREREDKGMDSSCSTEHDLRQAPPLLKCLKRLLKSLKHEGNSANFVVEIIYTLLIGAISLSSSGDREEGITNLRCLLGIPIDPNDDLDLSLEKLNQVLDPIKALEEKIGEDDSLTTSLAGKSILHQVKESLRLLPVLLQSSTTPLPDLSGTGFHECSNHPSDVLQSVIMTARLMPSLSTELEPVTNTSSLFFSAAWKSISESDQPEPDPDPLENFVWELPDSSLDKQAAKRKFILSEAPPAKRANQGPESAAAGFSRGVAGGAQNATPSASSGGPTRRDTFRQRKPNTSRPPSMHVDDYVARERNIDGAISIGSNQVNPVQLQRGRPPSIHVDEFMARQSQRERQNSAALRMATPDISKNSEEGGGGSKDRAPHQLKAELYDEQEIDIVFDEESGSDERGPFPQPDDNLQSPPVITGENSPGPVEGGESREMRDPVVKLEKEGHNNNNRNNSNAPVEMNNEQGSNGGSLRSVPVPGQQVGQPPLPPMPPPGRAMSMQSQISESLGGAALRGVQPPLPPGFPLQSPADVSLPGAAAFMGLQMQMQSDATLNQEQKFPWNFTPSLSQLRPNPMMPPVPPQQPYLPTLNNPNSSFFSPSETNLVSLNPYALSQLMLSKPNQLSIFPNSQVSSVTQPRAPPPPPPVPHPSQTIQQSFPQSSMQQLALGLGLGFSTNQMAIPPQMQQQQQQVYYPSGSGSQSQPVRVDQGQLGSQNVHQQQEQQDSTLALQQYFSSPGAIQALLSDRDKLCQLLEQHPKLMQMLQEQLSQI